MTPAAGVPSSTTHDGLLLPQGVYFSPAGTGRKMIQKIKSHRIPGAFVATISSDDVRMRLMIKILQ
jgi:hypothetical protein